MHFRIVFSVSQNRATISTKVNGRYTNTSVRHASKQTLKEFIMSCLDSGWDVDLFTIL